MSQAVSIRREEGVAGVSSIASGRGPAEIPAAAAEPIVPLLTGPLLPSTVLAVFSAASLLAVDAPGETRVISLLTRRASGVPNGLRVTADVADSPFTTLRPGDPAFVGAGQVHLRGLRLRATRVVRTAVPVVTIAPQAAALIARGISTSTLGVPAGPVADLRAALKCDRPAVLRDAVTALIGLGAGSTPGGDDVIAGLLAALHATRRPALVQQVSAAVNPGLAERTTLVSADLLRLAVAGHACAEALAVLRASGAAGFRPGALGRAVAGLLSVGHTSGADLATGIAIGLMAPVIEVRGRPRMTTKAGHDPTLRNQPTTRARPISAVRPVGADRPLRPTQPLGSAQPSTSRSSAMTTIAHPVPNPSTHGPGTHGPGTLRTGTVTP